ncbi:heterokaryon incompatibility protein-domain-containing protein [Halenospora varia]|nr:heterokaryon incompatibility protein-domain-containing protein [Halenospora varia]
MAKIPEPTWERKRKLADAVNNEPPAPEPPPTKLRKEIEQKMSQLDESIVTAKDGRYHARIPKERLESLAVNERGDIYPTILPSFRQSSVAPSKRRLRVRSNLCTRCAKIDLDTLLSRPHKTQAGQLVKNLSPVSNWEIDSCALCSLLSSTMDLRYWPSGRKVPLRTYSSNKMGNKPWNSISTNLLQAGYSERYIVSQPEGMEGPVKIIKDEIEETNFDSVKSWISLCQDKHAKICSIENHSSVPGLKLIGCITSDIILAEDKPYLALSYVWGSGSEVSENPNKLPETLPNTIEDAIIVAKKLGYRYLWVDRYCIDQESEEEKADQCRKMDLIYQNADLTIIAATGEDPTYGLPGVSLRKRKPQHLTACSKIGKHFLISAESWPKEAVEETKWKTRAWTYQEALLSRRRLVFTEQQMYFECYGMYCCESVHFPLQTMHRKDMQGFKSVFCSEKLVGIFPKGVGTTSIEIVRRIEEYSELNLTNPSDILWGMLGIFNAFQRSRLGIHHCLGIPILPSMAQRAKPIEGWTPSMGFFFGLFWDLQERSERRNGFPSWSWTGWYGPVNWKWADTMTWPEVTIDPGVRLSVELIDGQILKWEAFQEINTKHNMLSRLSNIIYLAAWTVDIPIVKREKQKDKDEYKAILKLDDGGLLDWQFESTSTIEFLPGQVCKGIILGHDRSGLSTGPAILVIGKVNNTMERVGLGWVDQWYYKRWNKDGVWEFANEEDNHLWRNPDLLEPLELVRSWEEIRLG